MFVCLTVKFAMLLYYGYCHPCSFRYINKHKLRPYFLPELIIFGINVLFLCIQGLPFSQLFDAVSIGAKNMT